MSKKNQPFNNPFGAVKLAQPPAPKSATVERPKKAQPAASMDEDARLFLESVGSVAPVRTPIARVPPAAEAQVTVQRAQEEAESLVRLAELVSDDGEFEVHDDAEAIEGFVRGFDAGVVRKLKRGEFGARATLDLHGRTREEARPALERFLNESRIAGLRCVLVVTGRGLHSPGAVPVLRQSTVEWLTCGRPARQVLAFCSARPEEGGAGALYVLLRR